MRFLRCLLLNKKPLSMRTTLTLQSHVSHSAPIFLIPCTNANTKTNSQNPHPFNHTNTAFCFCSQPDHISDLILSNSWSDSEDAQPNLPKPTNPSLTHETILYVLKKFHNNPPKALGFFRWVSVNYPSKLSASVYSLMLRIIGNKDWMDKFWVIAMDMSDRGIELDSETYTNLLSSFRKDKRANDAAALTQFYKKLLEKSNSNAGVDSAVKIISGSDWGEEAKSKLAGLDLTLSSANIAMILRLVHREPSGALGFFRWVAREQGFRHDAITYNAMIRVLGREGCVGDFWRLVDEMKSEGHEVDIDTYIKVLRQFQKKKLMSEAVRLYGLMMKGPYKPSLQDCVVLLRQISLCGEPDMELVYRVVRIYEESGHSLSKAVYDGIHRALTSVGRFDEADNILQTMKDAGFEPDNITYSQVVFGLCKAGRFDEACEFLNEMEARGCPPDIKTWTILIQGHCLAGEVDKAISCLTKMLEKNLNADADLLEVLVNGLCSKKRVSSAYNLLVEMVKTARLRPWQATYKNLIEKLLGEGKLEEAMELLSLMKKHNFPPYPEPFVNYISKSGTVTDAMDFLKALTVKKYPSVTAYYNVFQSFLKEYRHSEAQDLLYKCPHHVRNHSDIIKLFGSTKVGAAS